MKHHGCSALANAQQTNGELEHLAALRYAPLILHACCTLLLGVRRALVKWLLERECLVCECLVCESECAECAWLVQEDRCESVRENA